MAVGYGNSPQRTSRRKAQSLRPIYCAFINFPHDRDISLEIPGIQTDNYLMVFKKLGSPIQKYPNTKIYYSELLWLPLIQSEEWLIIPLAGEWEDRKTSKTIRSMSNENLGHKPRKTCYLAS